MKTTPFVPVALALSASVMLVPVAHAAGPAPTPNYNIGGALKEAAPPKPPVDRERIAPELPQAENAPFDLPDGGTLFIREFRLEGADSADEAELLTLLSPYGNKELSLAQIYEAANQVTSSYRSRGYLVAKAYVPQQDASGGVLTIRVVIGKYGSLRVDNASPAMDFLVEGTFEQATGSGTPVRKDALERAMLLTSDLPGVRMPKLTIAPGAIPGTTDFVVDAQPDKRVEGYMLGDNYGSRYTGRKRLSVGASVNSPFSLGDRLSLDGITSPAAGLQGGRASYSFPLSFDGLRTELAVSRTTYKLGDTYKDLEAEGHADTVEGILSYPIIRSQAENLNVALNLGAKRLQDKVWGETQSARKAAVARLRIGNQTKGTLLGLDSRTDISTTYTLGRLSFYDAAERADNEAGAHTVGDFSKFEVNLGGTVALTDNWSLSSSFKAQKAIGKNLDSSEQMGVSGPGAVIGYPVGIMSDNGYIYNAELGYTLPEIAGTYHHTIGLFFDTARVYIEDSNYTTDPHATKVSDIGISYYARFQYMEERYLVASLQLAEGLGPKPIGTEATNRTKVLAQIGLTF